MSRGLGDVYKRQKHDVESTETFATGTIYHSALPTHLACGPSPTADRVGWAYEIAGFKFKKYHQQ